MKKKYKHAKIRKNSNYIQLHCTIDHVRYRVSTRIPISNENLAYVEKNYIKLISDVIVAKKNKECNVGNQNSIKAYGAKVLELESMRFKDNTIKRYENIFYKHIVKNIGQLNIKHITPKMAKDIFYINFRNLSIPNKSLCLCVLKLIFNNACLDGLIHTNPFSYLKVSKKEHVKTNRNYAFCLDEMKTLLFHAKKNKLLCLYLHLAFYTGMRTNEILSLQVKDIDFTHNKIIVSKSLSNGKITTTKTGKTREIDIIKPLFDFLYPHFKDMNEDTFLFMQDKRIIHQNTLVNHFKNLLKSCNLKSNTLYATRHTFASICLQGGEDLLWVSSMLGHADSNTTLKHYAKYLKQDKQLGLSLCA